VSCIEGAGVGGEVVGVVWADEEATAGVGAVMRTTVLEEGTVDMEPPCSKACITLVSWGTLA